MDDMRVEYETERGGDRRYSRVGKSQERHTSQSPSPESGSHRKHSPHNTEEKKRDSSSSHLKRAHKRSRSRSSSGDFRAKHKSRKERYGPRSKNRSKDVKKRKQNDSSSERSDSECARKHRLTKLKQKYGEMKRRHKKQEQLYDYSSSGCTSDSDTSLDSYSADSSPVQHKKKSKRSAKTSHKLYKKKKKKHKMNSRRKKSGKTKSGKVRSSAETGFEGPHKQHHSPKQVPETQGISTTKKGLKSVAASMIIPLGPRMFANNAVLRDGVRVSVWIIKR